MSYSIYPKLRAIYSFLPTSAETEELLYSKDVSEFKNHVIEMRFLKRFPLIDSDIESHLRRIPFSLGEKVRKQMSEPSVLFFEAYLRGYELEDIKNIIRGGKGFFTRELRDKNLSIEELNTYMQNRFWKIPWNSGYSRYEEKKDKIELELPLDRYYYYSLLKETRNLSSKERSQVREFLLSFINLKNRVYLFRLKNFYALSDFEIKKLLIPIGEVYENIKEEKGLSEGSFRREISKICYKDFKFRMFTMRAILAFFFLLNEKINEILSIYRAKLLQLKPQEIIEMWRKLYVGS
ncbi:MAG: V-type ATPase subunit [candidate division WOR-3 bacterium]